MATGERSGRQMQMRCLAGADFRVLLLLQLLSTKAFFFLLCFVVQEDGGCVANLNSYMALWTHAFSS